MLVQKWRKVHTHTIFDIDMQEQNPIFCIFISLRACRNLEQQKKLRAYKNYRVFFLCAPDVCIFCVFIFRSFYLYFFSLHASWLQSIPTRTCSKHANRERVRKSTCASTSQHCMSDWRSLYGSSDSGWVGGEGAEEEGVMVSERRKFNNMYKIWGGQEEREWKWEGEKEIER